MHECHSITVFIWLGNCELCYFRFFNILLCVIQAVAINSEEVNKKVPVLSSFSVYGQHPSIDLPSRKFVRVGVVQRDFFRVSGVLHNVKVIIFSAIL